MILHIICGLIGVLMVMKYGRACVDAYKDERRIIAEEENINLFEKNNEELTNN